MKTWLKILIGVIPPIIILLLPGEALGIVNLTVIQQRVIALFLFATLFWILEPIPIFSTSVLIILAELYLLSDKGLNFMQFATDIPYGEAMNYKEIIGTFSSPIIILFLGGFFLAMSATKYRLDVNLARVILKPFGKNPALVMLGLMIITAVFSMFMSNTATTAMMLAILAPVLTVFEQDDKARIGYALAIPFAANIGGLGTPIGTPPNAVALKYLIGDDSISFGEWMSFAVPYVVVLLLICWIILVLMFRPTAKTVELNIKGKFQKGWKAITVYTTFIVTVVLWLFGKHLGLNSYIIAFLPVGVFTATGILTKEDLKKISWDVLWLVSGGIALGLAMEKTGLSKNLIESIPFDQFPALLIIGLTSLIALILASFMSHTATANLFMPIAAALGANVMSLQAIGGSKMVLLAVTFACSLAMSFPISTPPNAMAYATGLIKTKQMILPGTIIALIGLVISFGLLYILRLVGFV